MFDLFINQEMRNIRRQHHISKEVILDWSAFVYVQDSHPYVAIGKISAETRRFFVALVMPLSVQILFRPTIADLAIAIRLRSSVEQPLLVVISDPRKLNCVTCCYKGSVIIYYFHNFEIEHKTWYVLVRVQFPLKVNCPRNSKMALKF